MAKLNDKQRARLRQQITSATSWYDENQALPLTDPDIGVFTDQCERNIALLSGNYWELRRPGAAMKKVNNLLLALRVKQSVITGGEMHFIASATESRFLDVQEYAEGLINHDWKRLDFSKDAKRAAWDRYAYKFGVVEIGWHYKDASRDMTGDKPDATEIGEENIDAGAMPVMPGMEASYNPELEQQPDANMLDNIPSHLLTAASKPKPLIDDPFIERFSPRDFFVDPQCTYYTLETANYAFRRKLIPLSKVKSNKNYANTKDLSGNTYQYYKHRKNGGSQDPASDVKDELMLVEIYDGYYRDEDTDKVMHVLWASEIKKELLIEETPYPHFSGCNPFPFEVIPCTVTDNDNFYGMADVANVRDIQVASDESYSKVEYQRAHTSNVLIISANLLEGDHGEDNKAALESGVELAVIKSENPIVGGQAEWLGEPPPHMDSIADAQASRGEILQHIGVNEYEANMMPEKRLTATEASQLATQGANRQDEEVQLYLNFAARIANKVLTLDQQFIEVLREYSSEDDTGKTQFGKADIEQLRGIKQTPSQEFDDMLEAPGFQFAISVDASRMRPKNEYLERQELQELMGTLMPIAMSGSPLVSLPDLLRSVISKYDLPNADKIVISDEQMQALTQQAQQAQQAQQQGGQDAQQQNKIAESITFKDLPISGKIQMAAQIGIQLTPDDFAQQALHAAVAPGLEQALTQQQAPPMQPPMQPQPAQVDGSEGFNGQ